MRLLGNKALIPKGLSFFARLSMADDNEAQVLAAEPVPGNGAGVTPESLPATAAKAGADWRSEAEGLSDSELMEFLEKHPNGATVKERLGQSYADRVLLKDRKEVELQVRREIAEASWQERWASMTPQERVNYRIRQEELDAVKGQIVSGWWPAQASSLKDAVPELKAKDLAAFNSTFAEHPDSLGSAMGAFINEVADMRREQDRKKFLEKELPALVEAEVKTRLGKTLAAGSAPDLGSGGSGPSGKDLLSEEDHFKAYGRGESTDTARAQRYMKSMGL